MKCVEYNNIKFYNLPNSNGKQSSPSQNKSIVKAWKEYDLNIKNKCT